MNIQALIIAKVKFEVQTLCSITLFRCRTPDSDTIRGGSLRARDRQKFRKKFLKNRCDEIGGY